MLLESKNKSKSQCKEISFNGDSEDEFEKYIDFLYNNSERFQEEIKGKKEEDVEDIKEKWKGRLEKKLKDKLERTFNHKKSIYPNDTDYGIDNMLVDTTNQRVLFYEISEDGKSIKVHKCPHYKDFIKDLKEKGIEPKKDADVSILLDLLEVERHIAVKDSPEEKLSEDLDKEFNKRKKELEKKLESQKKSKKEKSDKEKSESKDSDKESHSTKEDPQKIWKRRPKERGIGLTTSYYNIHNPDSSITPEVYNKLVKDYEKKNESIKNIKCVKSYITESKMVSLIDYLKRMVG